MALLKCPWILFSSVFYFRGWVYMLGFALLMVLFVIKMRGFFDTLRAAAHGAAAHFIKTVISHRMNGYRLFII